MLPLGTNVFDRCRKWRGRTSMPHGRLDRSRTGDLVFVSASPFQGYKTWRRRARANPFRESRENFGAKIRLFRLALLSPLAAQLEMLPNPSRGSRERTAEHHDRLVGPVETACPTKERRRPETGAQARKLRRVDTHGHRCLAPPIDRGNAVDNRNRGAFNVRGLDILEDLEEILGARLNLPDGWEGHAH